MRYLVVATSPQLGTGNSMDSREVGPFESRRIAEEAAVHMVDDPRRYASIRIIEIDIDEADQ